MLEELWIEDSDIVQEVVIKIIHKKKKCKKGKWLSEEALQLRKEEKWKAKEKRKNIPIWKQSSREIARRDKKVFLSKQYKEKEENNRIGKTRDLFKKMKGASHATVGTRKDRNGMDLIKAEENKRRWQENTEELYKKILMTWITITVWSLT